MGVPQEDTEQIKVWGEKADDFVKCAGGAQPGRHVWDSKARLAEQELKKIFNISPRGPILRFQTAHINQGLLGKCFSLTAERMNGGDTSSTPIPPQQPSTPRLSLYSVSPFQGLKVSPTPSPLPANCLWS